MIIAQQKRKENIIEYLLYMWHIEDLMRAHRFDILQVREHIISRFGQPENVLQQMDEWYGNLIRQMKEEELQAGGHLHELDEQMHQLNDFHLNLINDLNEPDYRQAYHSAQPCIAELKRKSKPGATEIEVCLNALYVLMTMRMKKTCPSAETTEAIERFGRMLSLLNHRYMSRK
ncbi:MAG: DUF4924 family protein [Bacteroidales bacterium]|jgi:hypothetical protein|nr:DUF4924 family protein [Bacteroidales bacterium]